MTLRRDDLPDVLRALRALSDETRFRIVSLLGGRAWSVSDLAEELEVPQPQVSFHLRTLKSAGLVGARKDGKWVHYSINERMLTTLEQTLGRLVPEFQTLRRP